MENPILKYLEPINSLNVNNALWVFSNSFNDFYGKAPNLSLEQIDNWIKEFHDQRIEQDWSSHERRKYPNLFIYWMLSHYKFQTLREKKYHRENSVGIKTPNTKNDFHKRTSVAEQITKYASSLPFDAGVAFLGELMGAWVLTCPEAIIRSKNYIDNISAWRVIRQTTDWEVPMYWIKRSYSGDASEKVRDNETQLMFVLDFFLPSAADLD